MKYKYNVKSWPFSESSYCKCNHKMWSAGEEAKFSLERALSIRTVKIELAGENGMYFIFPVKHINDVVKKQLSSYTFWCNGNVPKFHQKFYSYFIRRGFSSCLSSIS